MTLIAGTLSRKNHPVEDSIRAALQQSISRNRSDEIRIFGDQSSFFAKVDIGAFGTPGCFQDPDGALTLLAGEPLLANHESDREQDLMVIHQRLLENDLEILRAAEGTFCVVHYQPRTRKLALVADKMGVRPLYYFISDDVIVFSSALRVLEELPFVPKRMDLRAVTEIVGLGYPLASRTPYVGISLLKPAEILELTSLEASSRRYWRWEEMKTSEDLEPQLLETVFENFQTAVQRRIRKDQTTAAYLSGGLDSRCVVAALRQADAQVHSFNFARPGTQDHSLGYDFAQRIGSFHQSYPKEAGDSVPDYSSLMAKVWFEHNRRLASPAAHPQLVWSGEGGSVLLGHVHLNEEIVKLMRAGETDGAIDEFLRREQAYVPAKLFKPEIVDALTNTIKQGIREELNELRPNDPARAFYLFLMQNDQRRKLARHFENIDVHRLEFQLPFFDGAFLVSVAAVPMDLSLSHRLYVNWLSRFPPAVSAVAWQAYPGHEPCPVQIPAKLAYQWDSQYQSAERLTRKRALLRRAWQLISAPDFPREILNKRNLWLAAWMHSLGLRDVEYAIDAAQTYYSYWRKCSGQWALPT